MLTYLPAVEQAAFSRSVRDCCDVWIANEDAAVFPDIAARARPGPGAGFCCRSTASRSPWADPHGAALDWMRLSGAIVSALDPIVMASLMPNTLQNRPSGVMNGGRALAEMLKLSGAGAMFGMGGFQLLPFYDAVGLVGLNHHLINDERCGAFAADAYARVTNRPGRVRRDALGPGATNLVTGLVESLNGGIPIVAIAGDTTRQHSWKNMTQESRQAEILKPAVKELIRVEMTSRIPELVRRAFAVATSRPARPVLLDVPEDVCHGTHDFPPPRISSSTRPP